MAYSYINPISAIVTFFVMLFVLMALLIHRNCCKKGKPVSTESAASVPSDNRRSQQTRSPQDVYIIHIDGSRLIEELPPPSYESLIVVTCQNQEQDQFEQPPPPCYDSIAIS